MTRTSPLSQIVDRKELATTLGLSLPTIDRMTKSGRIGPKAIQVSAGRVGWLRSSIEAWIGAAEQLGRLPNQREWAATSASQP
jgi:predicted DNA-binding transcriptional regulator AlpA